MLLFALGLGSSQSRFPASRSIPGWTPMVCSIGLTESMSSDDSRHRR